MHPHQPSSCSLKGTRKHKVIESQCCRLKQSNCGKEWSEIKGAHHGTGSQKFLNPSLGFIDAVPCGLEQCFYHSVAQFSNH